MWVVIREQRRRRQPLTRRKKNSKNDEFAHLRMLLRSSMDIAEIGVAKKEQFLGHRGIGANVGYF